MSNPSPEELSGPPSGTAIPENRHDLRVLTAIRRIIRATDLFSHRLTAQHGITVPQLVCLNKVVKTGGISIKDLAEEVFLSSSTVVGIVDRLEDRRLVERVRAKPDKRIVRVVPTEEGKSLAAQSPSQLHENLVAGLYQLPEPEQKSIADNLEKLVHVMEIENVEASPILEVSAKLDETPG